MTTSPFGGAPTSPFGGAPTGDVDDAPDAGWIGPFHAAAIARSSSELPAEPFGAPDPGPSPVAAPTGAHHRPVGVPAQRPPAEEVEVPEPAGFRTRLTRPERPSLGLPTALSGLSGGADGKRRRSVLAIALGGGALVAGALVAVAVLGATDGGGGGAVVVAGTTATPGSSATPSTGTPSSAPQPSAAFTPQGRDPFVALVAPVTGDATASAGATPDPVTTGTPGGTGSGTSVGGSLGGSVGGSAGGSVGSFPVPQTTVTVTAAPAPAATPLSTAQTCSAVAAPMAALEQLLTSSTTSATGPVDTGTALRTPVGAMRSAVSASGDAALASRLDVATSSAESLRSQLLAGVAVTPDQVSTQTSLDSAVRTACA